MPILEPKPLYAPCPMEDAAADQHAARKIQQYRFGERSVFLPAFPGSRYLPYGAVTRVCAKHSTLSPKGCCGATLPVIRIRLFYGGEFYQEFLFEKQKDADAALQCIRAALPEMAVEGDF